MNQEQAKFLTEFFATALEQEGKTTAKVLAAVREEGAVTSRTKSRARRGTWQPISRLATSGSSTASATARSTLTLKAKRR